LKLTEPKPGCYVYDVGQDMVGWVRLKVRGKAGQRITVRHGEMLNADGTLYTANLRSCPATDFYELSGKGTETLEPYFTFHGFRFVEIRGVDSKPNLAAVTGVVVHSDMRRTGNFECSYPLLNQLYHNIIWGQNGNYLEVPTDCPQRDERMGWTGDTQFFAPTAAYNYDIAGFFTRWLTTCRDNQNADGTFPHVVPDIMGGGGATAWGDAALLCAYNIYKNYADTRLVAEHFDAMQRYMRWLDGKTKDGISNVGGFGDWLNAGGGANSKAIDTAYHACLAQIMSEMALAIGRAEDAQRYSKLHEEIKAAFIKAFFQPDGSLKDCSQTGYALAFTMGLVPDELRAKAAEKFAQEIKRFDNHLATGFIGTPRLLPALHTAGRDDLALQLLLTDTYPSWLFSVKNGATTMWERWNGWTPEKGFGDISMNSFNHYAFGAVGEFIYGSVGGIQAASPSYKTIQIRPVIGDGLTWAKTSFDSIRGSIVSNWKREGGKIAMDVIIPPNTTATVYVPAKTVDSILESGKPAAKALGVKFQKMEGQAAVFSVEPGHYQFVSEN
jgi:alpha-L-rhamnosidase